MVLITIYAPSGYTSYSTEMIPAIISFYRSRKEKKKTEKGIRMRHYCCVECECAGADIFLSLALS